MRSGSSGITGRGRVAACRPDPGLRVCNCGICGTRCGWASGTGRFGSSGITGRGCAPARRPDPGLRVRACGICGMRGGRASGTGAVREFRDNRAGPRAVIDDAGEDAGGPREIGGAGSGHAHASRIAPTGFRKRPRAEALLAGAVGHRRARGYPDRLPIKARSRPVRERTMVRPARRRWRRRLRPRQGAPRPKTGGD